MKEQSPMYRMTICTKHSKRTIGCNYRYVITKGSTSHTAFRDKQELYRWLDITGMRLGKRTAWKTGLILNGEYTTNCVYDLSSYMNGKACKWLSNGDYTKGYITKNKGLNCINYCNPNATRIVYEHSIGLKMEV